jgi:hypothetical protein
VLRLLRLPRVGPEWCLCLAASLLDEMFYYLLMVWLRSCFAGEVRPDEMIRSFVFAYDDNLPPDMCRYNIRQAPIVHEDEPNAMKKITP